MEGQILGTTGAGSHGVIMGDDGARYTFTSQGWRDSSTVPIAGMRVDFEGRGAYAWSVHPILGAAPTWRIAPAAPVPPLPTAQARPIYPVVPLSSAPPLSPAPSQAGDMRAPEYADPEKSKTVVGLLLFLGWPGFIIAGFYVDGWGSGWAWSEIIWTLGMVIVCLMFPPALLIFLGLFLFFWLVGIVAGIAVLCMSEEGFDERTSSG